jgi:hypothetical protein
MRNILFLTLALWPLFPLAAQNKPAWTDRKPQDTAETFYFTSIVDECRTEDEAIRSAINNVNNAVANSTIVYIRSSVSERSRSTESRENFSINIETDSYTDVILSGIKTETYSEEYVNRAKQRRYRAWALASVSKNQIEENRRLYVETIARRYALDSAVRGDNLSAALSAYGGIYDALLENPLHQTIAVYGDGQSLFDYCRQRIGEIADSLLFDDIPPQSVQKGDLLTLPVRVSSLLFTNAAALTCTVTVRNANGVSPVSPGGVYALGGDNSFVLRLPASGLEVGNYLVNLELAMNTRSITRNPATSFRLEVRPASAQIRVEGETLSGAEQRMFTQAVQQALQKYHVPLQAGYEFLVMFSARTQTEPITGIKLLLCDVSVSLNSAGNVLFQSAPARITEISREQALKLASDHIRDDREFWTGTAKIAMNNK